MTSPLVTISVGAMSGKDVTQQPNFINCFIDELSIIASTDITKDERLKSGMPPEQDLQWVASSKQMQLLVSNSLKPPVSFKIDKRFASKMECTISSF